MYKFRFSQVFVQFYLIIDTVGPLRKDTPFGVTWQDSPFTEAWLNGDIGYSHNACARVSLDPRCTVCFVTLVWHTRVCTSVSAQGLWLMVCLDVCVVQQLVALCPNDGDCADPGRSSVGIHGGGSLGKASTDWHNKCHHISMYFATQTFFQTLET